MKLNAIHGAKAKLKPLQEHSLWCFVAMGVDMAMPTPTKMVYDIIRNMLIINGGKYYSGKEKKYIPYGENSDVTDI